MTEISQDDLRKLLTGGARKVHLVGVGGSGMSGLACLLARRGHRVTGSDQREDSDPDASGLRQLGVQRFSGHRAEHVVNPDFVCYSSAIPSDNPELLEAHRRGIPAVRRARALAAMVPPQQAVAVAGTHGKTTTSAMIAHILRIGGKDPSFFVGGHVPDLEGNAAVGRGEHYVIEVDESDGSMSEFHPQHLVILNIEPEHLDFYRNVEAIEYAFELLARTATESLIFCGDDPGASRVGQRLRSAPIPQAQDRKCELRIEGYSIDGGGGDKPEGHLPAWRATDIQQSEDQTAFKVWHEGKSLGNVSLIIPGLQNVSNALAALAMTSGLGVKFEVGASALANFHGARRRFDRLFQSEEFLLVDDYAHHPTEIRATIEAARQKGRKRLTAVFQPHRYSRVQALGRDFGQAFQGADRVFLTEIYAASELPIKGVNGQWVADAVASVQGTEKVVYEPDLWRLKESLGSSLQSGDLLLVMGAGNIGHVSRILAGELRVYDAIRRLVKPGTAIHRYEPMAKRTSMRTGGFAKLWIEPMDEDDLAKILRYCHERRETLGSGHSETRFYTVTFIGRGSNLLVRDAGISGVTIHLGAPAFTGIAIEGERLTVGAGARLKQVVMQSRRANLTGLEFLEGIPGSLGGALWMNAGAMGGATFDVVEGVRLMDLEGNPVEKKPSEMGVAYRTCAGMRGHVAISAVLKGRGAERREIDEKMKKFEAKRWDSQPAACSAGCIFKNPATISAGKLIEELGLKNLRFGRARVSDVHANFIVNDGGATASEVLGLISLVKDRARKERGIELETEVVVLGDERW